MANFTKHVVHVIFATKKREPTLPPRLDQELHAFVAELLRQEDCHPIAAGGGSDHRHLLFDLHPAISLSQVMKKVKARSSRWLGKQGIAWNGWQVGFGVFAVCAAHVPRLVRYIRDQRRHHGEQSFVDELDELLERN